MNSTDRKKITATNVADRGNGATFATCGAVPAVTNMAPASAPNNSCCVNLVITQVRFTVHLLCSN